MTGIVESFLHYIVIQLSVRLGLHLEFLQDPAYKNAFLLAFLLILVAWVVHTIRKKGWGMKELGAATKAEIVGFTDTARVEAPRALRIMLKVVAWVVFVLIATMVLIRIAWWAGLV